MGMVVGIGLIINAYIQYQRRLKLLRTAVSTPGQYVDRAGPTVLCCALVITALAGAIAYHTSMVLK